MTLPEIGGLLRNHLVEKSGPCQLLSQPGIVPRIRSTRNFWAPDLAVSCAPPSQALMVADPILLIEICSPSNKAQTRANIWTYTTIPSVRQILAVHSNRIEAEVLRRGSDGNWPAEPEILVAGDLVRVASIDFGVGLAAFFPTTALAC